MIIEDLIISFCNIKPSLIKQLTEGVSSSKELVEMPTEKLLELGLSITKINRLHSEDTYQRAKKECEFLFKNNVEAISVFNNQYPKNLIECLDAPFLIYKTGNFDISNIGNKSISIAGTRSSTPHGEEMCRRIISDIAKYHPDTVIITGLSYGIESVVQRISIEHGLKTVAVMVSGLDNIQPTGNIQLANKILESSGALISEYPSGSSVFKQHFSARNRIVAGLSKSTIIAESPINGGSMITASLANDYDRDVFAFAGRATDKSFAGCNNLIKSSKAQLIDSLTDIEYYMGWERAKLLIDYFIPELNGAEKQVYDCFELSMELTDSEIMERTKLSALEFFQAVTTLEASGLIKSIRGKLYIKL